jgi:ribosomal protein S18 acetylase RimI-like enzyme
VLGGRPLTKHRQGKNDSMTWLNQFVHGDRQHVTLRGATADDAYILADIVMTATKAQGRWPAMASADEADWRDRFAGWSCRIVRDADPDNVLAVVLDGEDVIGRLRVVRGTADQPFLRLAAIQLVPAAQGRGIGTAIVRGLQDVARRERVPLLIGVEKDNARARRLYERLGCVLTGEEGDEYQLYWTAEEASANTDNRRR